LSPSSEILELLYKSNLVTYSYPVNTYTRFLEVVLLMQHLHEQSTAFVLSTHNHTIILSMNELSTSIKTGCVVWNYNLTSVQSNVKAISKANLIHGKIEQIHTGIFLNMLKFINNSHRVFTKFAEILQALTLNKLLTVSFSVLMYTKLIISSSLVSHSSVH